MRKWMSLAFLLCLAVGTANAAGTLEVKSIMVNTPDMQVQHRINDVLGQMRNGALAKGNYFLEDLPNTAKYSMNMYLTYMDDEIVSVKAEEMENPGGVHFDVHVHGCTFSLATGEALTLPQYWASVEPQRVAAAVVLAAEKFLQGEGYEYNRAQLQEVAANGWYQFYVDRDGVVIAVLDPAGFTGATAIPLEVRVF